MAVFYDKYGKDTVSMTESTKKIFEKIMTKEALEARNILLQEELPEPKFNTDAVKILSKRYLLKNPETGEVVETPKELLARVAAGVTEIEKYKNSPDERLEVMKKYYTIMADLDFLPNSPTLMNAGKYNGQLSACMVIPVPDDLIGIMKAVSDTAVSHKTGGGTGMDFSDLRPANDLVRATAGVSSGPVSFMKIFDATTEQIKAGGARRGANMGILRVDHPDIIDFIKCKDDGVSLNNFNISISITDTFMKAVEQDEEYDLINPNTKEVTGTLPAREVWKLIVEHSWKTGDPGVVFIDKINATNSMKGEKHRIKATNPCGEQVLEPYEACNLGSINVNNFINDETKNIDWARLKVVSEVSTRFLNDVVDASIFPIPEMMQKVAENRKIGLGLMGFSDLLIKLEIPYDTKQAQKLGKKIMKTINDMSVKTSHEIALRDGSFPMWNESVWSDKDYAMRNAATTCIAPTGTLSMLANVSSGIEPIFSLAFVKNVMDDQKFYYIHPAVVKLVENNELSEKQFEEIKNTGYLTPELLNEFPHLVTAHDVEPKKHVEMQSAFQEHVHAAVSKTVNLPKNATVEDVSKIYQQAYDSYCKGITIYRDGSKEGQVLTTGTTAKKTDEEKDIVDPVIERNRPIRVARGDSLDGKTIKIKTGCGSLYVTISVDDDGNPMEIFCRLGKSGGCSSANMEVYGRLISGWLRAGMSVDDLVKQLRGISCSNAAFIEGGRTLSCADAVGIVLERYQAGQFGSVVSKQEDSVASVANEPFVAFSKVALMGGSCPECGGPMEYEGGCSVCKVCAHSKCG